MTKKDMERALQLERECDHNLHVLSRAVLIKADSDNADKLSLGLPGYNGNLSRHMVPLTDTIRRLAHREWRKGMALAYNAYVRELAQLGVETSHRLLAFDPVTGEPILESSK